METKNKASMWEALQGCVLILMSVGLLFVSIIAVINGHTRYAILFIVLCVVLIRYSRVWMNSLSEKLKKGGEAD